MRIGVDFSCMDLPCPLSTCPPVHVRPLAQDELGIALDWAALEGWNPGLHDAVTFFSADPGGFFGLVADDELIGTVSVVRYSDDFAFGGLYILRPEYRGRGVGYALQQEFALPFAGARTLGIDGVFGMQERYARAGFHFSHRNLRYEGRGTGRVPKDVVPLSEVPFEVITAYDRPFFPGPREGFLRAFLTQPGGLGFVRLDESDRAIGYGFARPCRTGYKLGPLFAETPAIAEDLFAALSSALPGEAIFLDLPEPNSAALELVQRHHMLPVFGTARMYSRWVPELPLARIYGITTFELG